MAGGSSANVLLDDELSWLMDPNGMSGSSGSTTPGSAGSGGKIGAAIGVPEIGAAACGVAVSGAAASVAAFAPMASFKPPTGRCATGVTLCPERRSSSSTEIIATAGRLFLVTTSNSCRPSTRSTSKRNWRAASSSLNILPRGTWSMYPSYAGLSGEVKLYLIYFWV